ncbi:MAG: glycosyltransferase family 4 protein [Planctomycetota bacterium]
MKIAFSTWKFPALANTFILNEIVEVIRRGHDVRIYSIDRSDDRIVHDDVARYSLLDRTRYLEDYVPPERARSRAMDRYTDDWLRERAYALPVIARRLRHERVDLVHGCFCNNSATVAMVVARLARIPFSFECHAHDLFVDLRHGEEKIREAARIFPISDYNRRYLVEDLGCDPAKIRIRRVPIHKEHCDAIPETDREEGLVSFVGRLHPIKGLMDAVEAFSRVAEKIPSAKFRIIGDGELRGALEERVRVLGLQGRVEFAGAMTNREALEIVRRSAVFLLPSVIASDKDRDGIPTSMIEAMYLRTPVVSTRVSGIPELIEDGVEGFLAEPGDVEAIASSVERLLTDPGLRNKMGERARMRIDGEFDRDRNLSILIGEWEAMCAERRPSAIRRLGRLLLRR